MTMDHRFFGLAASEAGWDFAMLLLAFVASTRRFAFA